MTKGSGWFTDTVKKYATKENLDRAIDFAKQHKDKLPEKYQGYVDKASQARNVSKVLGFGHPSGGLGMCRKNTGKLSLGSGTPSGGSRCGGGNATGGGRTSGGMVPPKLEKQKREKRGPSQYNKVVSAIFHDKFKGAGKRGMAMAAKYAKENGLWPPK